LKDSNALWGLSEIHKDELCKLGEVICEHNLESLVGVSLVHRHHTLTEEERIVWELTGDVWCAKSRYFNELKLTPINWGVGNVNGFDKLFPLEYCVQDERHSSESLISKEIMSNTKFIEDFVNLSVKLKVDNLFGLALLQTKKHFNRLGFTVFEQSDISRRITKAKAVPENEVNMISDGVTLWNFMKKHDGKAVRGCAYGNTQHCCGGAITFN